METICVTADTGFEHQKPIPAAEWVEDALRFSGKASPGCGCPECQEELSRDGRASRKVSVSAIPAVHFGPVARSD